MGYLLNCESMKKELGPKMWDHSQNYGYYWHNMNMAKERGTLDDYEVAGYWADKIFEMPHI